jgi:protoporphyrinogen/coproporphyrinogen III oxidase
VGPGVTTTVAVVGGGISGLAAAWRLVSSGENLKVFVLEASDRVGGVLRTEIDGEWVIEGGPESFLSAKPRGTGLARELGLEDRFQWTNEATKGSYLLRDGVLHRMPEGLTGLIPTQLGPMARTKLVSPAGKLRMLLDYVIPARKGDDDETLRSFIGRRLGLDVYAHLIEPLMAGIYSGSGAELSLAATFPQLRVAEKEHGGLIRGVLAQRKAAKARPIGHQQKQGFLSFRTGIHELTDALRDAIESHGGIIQTRRRVERIDRRDDGRFVVAQEGDGRSFSQVFDKVILAAPAHVQAELLQHVSPDAASAMSQIPVVSTALILLGYRETDTARPPGNHGYLVPRAERRKVKALTWMSSKWDGRAPEGHFLVRGFVGRSGEQEILQCSDDELVDVLREELREISGIEGKPVLARVFRCTNASPQYTLGHLDRVARIEAAVERVPGLAVAGNMLRGVGIPDVIASGEHAADRLLGAT